MRVLALLPTLNPPAHLTALAAFGHDVHLVATRPGLAGGYMAGVRVWSTGFWWKARQGGQPHVILTQAGDHSGRRLASRMGGRIPVVSLPAEPGLTGAELTAVMLAALPAGRAREAARTATVDLTAPDSGRPVDVIAWVHYGIPYRRAGSEVMLHAMLSALQQAGMGVLAVTSEMPEAPPRWELDGVEYRQMPHGSADILIRRIRPAVVVTHHHLAPGAIRTAKDAGARSVLTVHNDHSGQAVFLASEPDLTVYNTSWVRESLRPDWPQVDRIPGLVVHPPVDPAEHQADTVGDHVTLVNLSVNKGVGTFRAVAELLPKVPFLGVTGAHGTQQTVGLPRNVTVIGQTSDMRGRVWARTRVLLMPSVYESYGMAAVEALASGIPVIADPTPGLREALGDAGTFIDRDDPEAWAAAVERLYPDGPDRQAAVDAAFTRSAYLADRTGRELESWTAAIRDQTATQYIRDMVEAGHSGNGEKNGSVVLAAEDVHEIRRQLSRGVRGKAIAAEFGVSPSTISLIRQGKTWGWLPVGLD